MKNFLKLLVFTVALTMATPDVQAQGKRDRDRGRDRNWGGANNSIGRWEVIGTQTVSKSGDRDNFRPSNRSSFSALKVRAMRSTVTVNRMTIVFENGDRQDIPLRRTMSDGEESNEIRLRHRRRIDRIEFYYKTRNIFGSRGQIQVWAKR